MRFTDRVAIVTGGASGFGEAIAKRFAAEGAKVVVADLDEAKGKGVVSAIESAGGQAAFARTDVASSADVKRMVDLAAERFGGLDVLVNNAGLSHRMMPMEQLPDEDFDRQFAVNVRGVFLGCKHAIPLLRKRGRGVIVNTASIGGKRPRPNVTVYNATKGAVITLTRGLAFELAASKIRVCAVNPVASDTGFMKSALGPDGLPDALRTQLEGGVPLGRLAEPRDVAAAVLFLASDDADFLTGVCLDVDGGRSIG